MKRLRVRCDLCGWFYFLSKSSYKSIKRWHNEPCPQCGRGIIISDYDLHMYKMYRILGFVIRFLNKASLGYFKMYAVHLDTTRANNEK